MQFTEEHINKRFQAYRFLDCGVVPFYDKKKLFRGECHSDVCASIMNKQFYIFCGRFYVKAKIHICG